MNLGVVWHELRLAAIAWQFLTRIALPSALIPTRPCCRPSSVATSRLAARS